MYSRRACGILEGFLLLANILSYGPPLILVVGMLGVGMSITRRSADRIARRPDRLAIVTVLQFISLPLVGVISVAVVQSPEPVAMAILLISICPGGGISNLYVLFAGANVTLSVAMTLGSLVLASVTIPLVIATMTSLGIETPVSETSVLELSLRLLVVIVLPILAGMLVRRFMPNQARMWQRRLRRMSLVMIFTILALVLWIERAAVASAISAIIPAVAIFLALSLAIGSLVGRLFYSDAADRFAVTVEFGVRNLAVGTFLAVSLGNDLSFVGPAAIYLVIEAITILWLGSRYRVVVRG